MTKKLILLILALPLFLMICLFTATSGVSLAVPISVSGIELLSESTVYMDLDNPREQHLIEYAVYPTNAANQDVTLSYLPLEDEEGEEQPLAQFEYDEETGYLKPLAPGAAEVVLTTVDGGYSVRFTAIVETKELVSIESVHPTLSSTYDEELGMAKYTLEPGNTFKIQNNFNPVTASNLLVTYKSSDPAVANVNGRGVVQARGTGVAIITVTSRANEYISYSFALEVKNPDNQSIVIVDRDIVSAKSSGKINMAITTNDSYELEYNVVDKEGNVIQDANSFIILRKSDDNTAINYYFANDEYFGTVYIDVTLRTSSGEVTTIRCTITKVALSDENKIQVAFDYEYYDMYLQTDEIFFQILPDVGHNNFTFKIKCDNDNMVVNNKVTYYGDSYYSFIVTPKAVGTTIVTIEVTNNETDEVTTKTIPIIIKPSRILATNPGYGGIENSYTIGKYNADGSLYSYKLEYTINDAYGEGFYDNVKWTSSSDAVYVNEDGRIVFVEGKEISDFVTFTAKFYYGDNVIATSQAIKIRCVSNGYNVTSYKELVEVTRAGKVVILQKDIVYDFGADIEKSGNLESSNRNEKNVVLLPNEQIYTTLKSTYDITWYKNAGIEDKANVKVLISFKDDVYGNGHIINADNVVSYGQWKAYNNGQPQLEVDKALFQGPLSFVALADGTSSGKGAVSVAAQDNICFAAYEGVTLNNIELIGRNMDADENGNNNLQNLHYAGTVVEVLGDNVTIEYSRVKNGRNVIRAFGDAYDANKAITFTVKNTVLSSSRDFIMRIGSNAFVNGTVENPSPYLPDLDPSDNIDFSSRLNYYRLTDEEKAKYDAQFIKTNVVLHNSVLENPGIFAIGMDSHFAGTALADGRKFSSVVGDSDALDAWYNLAKTSYGAKLTLTGDVRMYCWKNLDTIDSSSLIETNGKLSGSLETFQDQLEFVIPKLVRQIVDNDRSFSKAIYNAKVNEAVANSGRSWYDVWKDNAAVSAAKDDKMQNYDTVHAGIVFFGGGKNYGVLDTSGYTNFAFNSYEISLVTANKAELQLAAGKESFYFYIYDSTTLGFLPEDQDRMQNNSDEGYSCLYKK